MCKCWINLSARRIFFLLFWHQQRSCWDGSDVCSEVPRLPQRALGWSTRLMFLRMRPEVPPQKSSGRRVKSGMAVFSTLWDIFLYFLIKVKFRSLLGRNRDGMCVPTFLRSSLRAHSASPAQGVPGWTLAKGRAVLSLASSRAAGTLRVTHRENQML